MNFIKVPQKFYNYDINDVNIVFFPVTIGRSLRSGTITIYQFLSAAARFYNFCDNFRGAIPDYHNCPMCAQK
jgi:hypothetical protein